MTISDSLFIAISALKVNKLRSFLTMLGIIIGVASVVVLVSLGAGLRSYITGEFEKLGSNLLFIIPGRIGFGGRGPGGATVNKLSLKHVELIEKKVKGLTGVAPTVQQFASVGYQGKIQQNVTLLGTNYLFPKVANLNMENGSFFNKSQSETGKLVAVVGKTLVDDLFLNKNPIGEKIEIKGQKYKVIGVLAAQGSTFGLDRDNVVIIPLVSAQRQFGISQINNIYAKASTQAVVHNVREEIKKVLLTDLSEDDFSVMTAEQTLSTIQTVLRIISAVLAGIAAISLLVGGIGISNIMLVSVTERTREIGLRKAVGAAPYDILIQFLIEAVILSIFGGIIGLSLALVGAFVINQFIPAVVTLWSVLLAFIFSFLVGVIFGVMPALRAARLNPIEALRYE